MVFLRRTYFAQHHTLQFHCPCTEECKLNGQQLMGVKWVVVSLEREVWLCMTFKEWCQNGTRECQGRNGNFERLRFLTWTTGSHYHLLGQRICAYEMYFGKDHLFTFRHFKFVVYLKDSAQHMESIKNTYLVDQSHKFSAENIYLRNFGIRRLVTGFFQRNCIE